MQEISASEKQQKLTVFFDGSCPLCRREIGEYKNLKPLNGQDFVCYRDVSYVSESLPEGFTQEQLLTRFHVQGPNGELHSGAKAFLTLWSVLPGWRWFAFLGRLPGMPWLMEQSYQIFLKIRPSIQKIFIRFER